MPPKAAVPEHGIDDEDGLMGESEFQDGAQLTRLLVVRDLGAARDFYRDVLGAHLTREYGGTSAVLRLFGTWLLLVTGGGPTVDKPTIAFVPPEDPDRVSHEMTFRVPDCQAAYAELRRRGAVFLTPPVNHGTEIRCFLPRPGRPPPRAQRGPVTPPAEQP